MSAATVTRMVLLAPSSSLFQRRMWSKIDRAMSMTRQQVLDLYFMEARAKLIDLAAFLDRVDRADGGEDFRLAAFRRALAELQNDQPQRAKAVLLTLSDPTIEPLAAATTKAAAGAWPGAA